MNFPHPPTIDKPFCTWGMHTDFRIDLKRNKCTNFVLINNYEYLLLTLTSTFLCEKGTVKETSPMRLLAAVYIPSYDFIVGVSSTNNDFVVFRRSDIENPFYTNIHIGQLGIFHMLFSPRSNTIITVGQDIRTWKFQCLHREVRLLSQKSEILIDFNSVIPITADSSMMNAPCFDYQSEDFILPSYRGYKRISIDGKFSEYATKLSSTDRTPIAFYPQNNSIATSDITDGTCLWLSGANLILREHFTENPLISIRFINEEFLLGLDIKLDFYLINLYTEEVFHLMELSEKPQSITFFESYGYKLAIVFDASLVVYDVVVPWHLWQKNIIQPNSIKLCRLPYSASRIAIQRDVGVISLVSPKTKDTLATASFDIHRRISKFFYDRHIENGKLTDRLLVILKNGYVALFQTKSIKCELIKEIDLGAVSIFGFLLNGVHHYGVGTMTGDLVFYNSNTFEVEKRFTVLLQSLVGAFYDKSYDTIIMVYDSVLVRYDYKKMHLMQKINVRGGEIVEVDNNFIVMGYPNGSMNFIEIRKDFLRLHTNEGRRYHLAPITGISFGRNFFISASLDSTIKIWSYKGTNISTITLPFSVLGIEILNGRRDMIFGTEKELMIIEGKNIFADPFESEDPSLDNYNRLDDLLPDQLPIEINEEEEEICTNSTKSLPEAIEQPENVTNQEETVKKVKKPQSQEQNMTDDMKDKIYQQMLLMSNTTITSAPNKPKQKETHKAIEPTNIELNKSQTLNASRKDIHDWLQTESKRKKKSPKKSPKKKKDLSDDLDSNFDIKNILKELKQEKQITSNLDENSNENIDEDAILNENINEDENANEIIDENENLNENINEDANANEIFDKNDNLNENSNQNSDINENSNQNSDNNDILNKNSNQNVDKNESESNLDEKTNEFDQNKQSNDEGILINQFDLNKNERESNDKPQVLTSEINNESNQNNNEIDKIAKANKSDLANKGKIKNETKDNSKDKKDILKHQKSPKKNKNIDKKSSIQNPIIDLVNNEHKSQDNETKQETYDNLIDPVHNSNENKNGSQNKKGQSNSNEAKKKKLATMNLLPKQKIKHINAKKNFDKSKTKSKKFNSNSKTVSTNNTNELDFDSDYSNHNDYNQKTNSPIEDLAKPNFNFPSSQINYQNDIDKFSNEYGSSEGDDLLDYVDQNKIVKPPQTIKSFPKSPRRIISNTNYFVKFSTNDLNHEDIPITLSNKLIRTCYQPPVQLFSHEEFIFDDVHKQHIKYKPKRSRTPPLIKTYHMHIPNYIYDYNSVLREVENGNLSLLPILERMKREGLSFINSNEIVPIMIDGQITTNENSIQCNCINFPDYMTSTESIHNGRRSQLYFRKNLFEDEILEIPNKKEETEMNKYEPIPDISTARRNCISERKNPRFNSIKQLKFDKDLNSKSQAHDPYEEMNRSLVIKRLIKPKMNITRRRNQSRRRKSSYDF